METPVVVCFVLSLAVLTVSAGGTLSRQPGYVWYALYPSAEVLRKDGAAQYRDSSLTWSDCGSSSGSVATVTSVTVTPDPPEKGKDLAVSSVFKLGEQLSGGTLKVKMYYARAVRVMNTEFDICTLVKEAGGQCPLEAGTQTISFTETLPSYVPSGTYSGTVKAFDLKGNEIACIKVKMPM